MERRLGELAVSHNPEKPQKHEKIPVQGIVWNANGYYYAIYSDKYLDMKEVEELIGRIVSTKEYQVGN